MLSFLRRQSPPGQRISGWKTHRLGLLDRKQDTGWTFYKSSYVFMVVVFVVVVIVTVVDGNNTQDLHFLKVFVVVVEKIHFVVVFVFVSAFYDVDVDVIVMVVIALFIIVNVVGILILLLL
jgi:hypothetical protein